jgi:hypothetical protein
MSRNGTVLVLSFCFVSQLSIFWINRSRLMRTPCYLYILSIDFWMAETILRNLICISWLLSPSQHRTSQIPPISLCACIPLSFLGSVSVKTLPREQIHAQQQKNCWRRRLLCGPYRIKESRRLVLPRTYCLIILGTVRFAEKVHWM